MRPRQASMAGFTELRKPPHARIFPREPVALATARRAMGQLPIGISFLTNSSMPYRPAPARTPKGGSGLSRATQLKNAMPTPKHSRFARLDPSPVVKTEEPARKACRSRCPQHRSR